MKRFIKLVMAAILGSAITIGVFVFTGLNNNQALTSYKNTPVPVKNALYTVNKKGEIVPIDFTEVSKKVMDAVVHIKTSVKVPSKNYGYFYFRDPFGDMFDDDFFKRFFGEPPKQKQSIPKQEPFIEQGVGSGVIINGNGYIVTNNHVVDGAVDIEVSLHNNETYKAKVIGTDPSTDLALIQIKANDLTSLPIGNSDSVEVGEWVLAVGNPFNLNSTVTAGIVSAKGRNINIINDRSAIEAFIQTDAAINPGNSGGALVNLNGELIGINTAIATTTGAYAGYGFAIPVNIVSKVVEDIMKYGMVQRAYLGVLVNDINGEFAKDKKLDVSEGAYVDSLMDKGAAREAGIKEGDVITKVDGVSIKKTADLLEQIGRHRPGDKINVTINRKGKEMNFEVVLANQKGVKKILAKEKQDIFDILGATFESLDNATAKKLNIDGGVVVKDLNDGVLKKQTDMREGFIITSVNNKKVRSVDELKDELKDYKGGVMLSGVYEDFPGDVYYAFGLD
jgi:Do/DeqQ family serine protease